MKAKWWGQHCGKKWQGGRDPVTQSTTQLSWNCNFVFQVEISYKSLKRRLQECQEMVPL